MTKLLAVAILLSFVPLMQGQDEKIRVYVTDDPIFEHTGIIRGSSDSSSSAVAASSSYGSVAAASSQSSSSVAGVSHTQNGADPRTTEIQADIAQNCPGVTVTSVSANADYVMILRRQGGKRSAMFAFGGLSGLALSATMKVNGASLFDRNGDMVYAIKARSVEKAVKDSCPHMVKYAWTKPAPSPAVAPAPLQGLPTTAAAPNTAPVVTPVPVQATAPQPAPASAPVVTTALVQAKDPASAPVCLASTIYSNGVERCTRYAKQQ